MMRRKNLGGALMTEVHANEIDPEQRRQFWKDHIDGWQKSGLSQVAYCREHDLTGHQLTYWEKRFVQSAAPVSFVPLRFSQNLPTMTTGRAFILFTPNGYKIEVGAGFDPAALKQLLSTVQSI